MHKGKKCACLDLSGFFSSLDILLELTYLFLQVLLDLSVSLGKLLCARALAFTRMSYALSYMKLPKTLFKVEIIFQ